MRMVILLILGLMAVPLVSAVKIADIPYQAPTLEITEDSKQEVNATGFYVNDSMTELILDEHPDASLAGNYKWQMVLYDLGGVDSLRYYEEDAQGGFDNSQPLAVGYANLTNFGVSEVWTNESGEMGYMLFSNGAKNQFPKRIRIELPSPEHTFRIYAGTDSVRVDGGATSDSIITPSHSIAKDSQGRLHVVYEDSNSDPVHKYSDNNGSTWSSGTILDTITIGGPIGVMVNSTDGVTVYTPGVSINDGIWFYTSHDRGATFSAEYEWGATFHSDFVSCGLDSQDIAHCCFISDDSIPGNNELYYSNFSSKSTVAVNTNNGDDTWQCDIELDDDDTPWIIGIGADHDDLDIWSPKLDGWGDANRVEIRPDTGWSSSETPTLAIRNNKMAICLTDPGDNDLTFANSSTDNGYQWDIQENVWIGTARHVNTMISNTSEVFCNFATSIGGGGVQYRMNSSDWTTWDGPLNMQTGGGPQSIADRNWPEFARAYDLAHITTMAAASQVHYFNYSIRYQSPSAGEPADTCTYTSGNWIIDADDQCSIGGENLAGNDIICRDNGDGAGYVDITSKLTMQGGNIFAHTGCQVNCYAAEGCFG